MRNIRAWVTAGVLVLGIGAYLIWGNSSATPVAANTTTGSGDMPSPTPSSTTDQFTHDLAIGSTGADVTALQQFLINQKYLMAVSSPTGYFGILTKAAVVKFQAKNNISIATGYFGPKTRAIMNGIAIDPAVVPPTVPTSTTAGAYKNGTYTGTVADAIYGNLQVAVAISGGKIADITFPTYPNGPGRTSQLAALALPKLKQEAIASQSANVAIVSGATQDSEAFRESLASALSQAKS